jgi:hypothetical protein
MNSTMIKGLCAVALIMYTSIFANPLAERAKEAENLLLDYQLPEAMIAYTNILEEIDLNDKVSLEIAYWIFRERSFAAYLLGDVSTTLSDIENMKMILTTLGHPESTMEEYYYALDLARKAKESFSEYNDAYFMSCGFGSWCRDSWNNVKLGFEKTRSFLDESLARVTFNEDRLEQLLAQKRAREYYYPYSAYSQEEIEFLAQSIQQKDLQFGQDLREFLWKNKYQLSAAGAGVIATIVASEISPKGGAVLGLSLFSQSYEFQALVQEKCAPLWGRYMDLQRDHSLLIQMDMENREASYTKCVLNNISPPMYYAPEKDTGFYNGYYSFDMNSSRYDFRMGVSKNF